METLRNMMKLAAVSRETPQSTKNSRRQNTPDAESTQDYISQVSDEIEGRVTKKLSKEFSRIKWNNHITTDSHHERRPYHTTNDNKKNHSLRWPSVKMEYNRDCDTVREVYGKSKFADFPLNVDKNWQKNSSQGNQYNEITISNQKTHTYWRVLRSYSGAIQAQ